MISSALNDINAAINHEPLYIDAYWQRHLVNVLLSRQQQAVDDLDALLCLKKDHVPALKSRLVTKLQYDNDTILDCTAKHEQ